MAQAAPFSHEVKVRYIEIDQQGVVFNMWYLAWFDDAMTAFLEHGGLPYEDMIAAGYDAQLVHTELDWTAPVRWGDRPKVDVSLLSVGTTSFTLQFQVRVEETVAVTGRTVYITVATDGTGKREVPPLVRDALGSPTPESS